MPVSVHISSEAQNDVKRLKRKHPAVTSQIRKLINQLENDERRDISIEDIRRIIAELLPPSDDGSNPAG